MATVNSSYQLTLPNPQDTYDLIEEIKYIPIDDIIQILEKNISMIKTFFSTPVMTFSKWKIIFLSFTVLALLSPIIYYLIAGTIAESLIILGSEIVFYGVLYTLFKINAFIKHIIKTPNTLNEREQTRKDLYKKIDQLSIDTTLKTFQKEFEENGSKITKAVLDMDADKIFAQFQELLNYTKEIKKFEKENLNLFKSKEILIISRCKSYNMLMDIYKKAAKALFDLIKIKECRDNILNEYFSIAKNCFQYRPRILDEEKTIITEKLTKDILDFYQEHIKMTIDINIILYSNYQEHIEKYFIIHKLNTVFEEYKNIINRMEKLLTDKTISVDSLKKYLKHQEAFNKFIEKNIQMLNTQISDVKKLKENLSNIPEEIDLRNFTHNQLIQYLEKNDEYKNIRDILIFEIKSNPQKQLEAIFKITKNQYQKELKYYQTIERDATDIKVQLCSEFSKVYNQLLTKFKEQSKQSEQSPTQT